jgi:hypothetical protein
VADLNTKGYALSANIAFCHFYAPPDISTKNIKRYFNTRKGILQEFYEFFFKKI